MQFAFFSRSHVERSQVVLLVLGTALVIGLLAGGMGWWFGRQLREVAQPPTGVSVLPPGEEGEGVACTMDALMCPDGSYVGRTGPKCEFICPSPSPVSTGSAQLTGDRLELADFSVRPGEFKVLEQSENMVKLLKEGPTQVPQSEVNDGALITVEVSDAQSTEVGVDTAIAEVKRLGGLKIVENKKPVIFGKLSGYSYKTDGYGTSTTYFLSSTSIPTILEIRTTVEDPANLGFQMDVNALILSLQLK